MYILTCNLKQTFSFFLSVRPPITVHDMEGGAPVYVSMHSHNMNNKCC